VTRVKIIELALFGYFSVCLAFFLPHSFLWGYWAGCAHDCSLWRASRRQPPTLPSRLRGKQAREIPRFARN